MDAQADRSDALAAAFEHFRSGLSNGFVEGINRRIQAVKARARGYATDRPQINVSQLICSNLKHLPKSPWTHATQQVAA